MGPVAGGVAARGGAAGRAGVEARTTALSESREILKELDDRWSQLRTSDSARAPTDRGNTTTTTDGEAENEDAGSYAAMGDGWDMREGAWRIPSVWRTPLSVNSEGASKRTCVPCSEACTGGERGEPASRPQAPGSTERGLSSHA